MRPDDSTFTVRVHFCPGVLYILVNKANSRTVNVSPSQPPVPPRVAGSFVSLPRPYKVWLRRA